MDTVIDTEQQHATVPEPEVSVATNFADKKKTIEKALSRITQNFDKFKNQKKRKEFEATMTQADAMLRMAEDQDKQTKNKTSDEIDCVPDIFFRVHRAITASETDVLVRPTDPPGEYEPLEYLPMQLRDDTIVNCDKQNLILEYSRTADGRKAKEEDAIWSVNKYGTIFLGIEWHEAKYKTKERRPADDYTEENQRYAWKTLTQNEAFPEMTVHANEDIYLDAMIDDPQKQQCILIRRYPLISDIVTNTDFKNIDKIKKEHYYSQEYPSEVKTDRATNAGDEGDEDSITGMLDEWIVYLRAPITDEGKWDEKKQYPRWFRFRFEGNIEACNNPVCVELVRNPYWYERDEIPLLALHSHKDDNGIYHAGYAKHIAPAYKEYKTTIDQWFYNKDLQSAAPMITEFGAIYSRSKTWGPRNLIVMQDGKVDRLTRLQIPDNTQNMQAFITYLEDRIKHTAGTSETMLGEALGGRTSALESDRIYSEANKPKMQKLRYIANQLYPWMARWDMAMWRQYSDPALTLALTREGVTQEIKPSTVWGAMRYKVVAIDQYERTTIAKHEEDRFNQTVLPLYLQAAGKKLFMKMLRYIYKKRDFPVDDLMPESSDTDARGKAREENTMFSIRKWVAPLEGQAHDIHLDEHEQHKMVYKTLGAEAEAEVLSLLDTHIAMTKQMMTREHVGIAQATAQVQNNMATGAEGGNAPGIPGMGSPESAPTNAGEAAGDMYGANMGGMVQ